MDLSSNDSQSIIFLYSVCSQSLIACSVDGLWCNAMQKYRYLLPTCRLNLKLLKQRRSTKRMHSWPNSRLDCMLFSPFWVAELLQMCMYPLSQWISGFNFNYVVKRKLLYCWYEGVENPWMSGVKYLTMNISQVVLSASACISFLPFTPKFASQRRKKLFIFMICIKVAIVLKY